MSASTMVQKQRFICPNYFVDLSTSLLHSPLMNEAVIEQTLELILTEFKNIQEKFPSVTTQSLFIKLIDEAKKREYLERLKKGYYR